MSSLAAGESIVSSGIINASGLAIGIQKNALIIHIKTTEIYMKQRPRELGYPGKTESS